MFIELAEFLHCPENHDPDPYLVIVRDEMVGRHVTAGRVACPTCHREYPITEGTVRFGSTAPQAPGPVPDADVVQALLGLGGPGGNVVMVGSAVSLVAGLAERVAGIHFVGVNPPPTIESAPVLSRLLHPHALPLKRSMARGVVIGAEHCTPSWLAEGSRVLLKGLRLVALRESVPAIAGLHGMAVGKGMWVGEKTV